MSDGQTLAVSSPVLSLVTLLPPQLHVKTCAIPRNACPTPILVPLQATASTYPSQKPPERVVSPWIHQFSSRGLVNSFILSFGKQTEFILRGGMEDTKVCGKVFWGSGREDRQESEPMATEQGRLQCRLPRGMTAGGMARFPRAWARVRGGQGGIWGRGAGRNSGSLSMVSARQGGWT